MADIDLRYMRARGLAANAVDTLVTHPGGIRDRLAAVDIEFFLLHLDELPDQNGLRSAHAELRSCLTRMEPKADEGRITATIRRSRLSTLERAAGMVLALYKHLHGCT